MKKQYHNWVLLSIGCGTSVVATVVLLLQYWQGQVTQPLDWAALCAASVATVALVRLVWNTIADCHLAASAHDGDEADDPRAELRTNTGARLDDLANRTPQLVVFLRQAGCTFCRQALADIQAARADIEATGCEILFVHLGTEEDWESTEVFKRFALDDVPRISDPTCRLYRQFGLDLGGFWQLFGFRVFVRGVLYGFIYGRGIGGIRGNSFQMPGVFLYHCGTILGGFRHQTAADRANYLALAQQIQLDSPALAG